MLIVDQKGEKRFNYNNVESIELKKEQKTIYLRTISGELHCLGRFETEENAEACVVALDQSILDEYIYNLISISSEEELKELYDDMYIFYVAEHSNLTLE